jgi:biotin carboxyl carrier protein
LAQEIVEVPITGKVTKIECKAGDTINEGDVICYIESMKMENPILAPVSGKVTEIKVSVGETAETGNVIAIIEH